MNGLLERIPTLAEIQQERARRKLLAFTCYTKPDYEVNWHHAVLGEYLDRFVSGEIKRLIVEMPPRHGKSEQVSRRLPAYILGRYPDAGIIACSYSADLAQRMNRDVQRIIDGPQYYELFPDSQLYGTQVRTVAKGSYLRNSDIFEIVGHDGYYRSAGVGGGITGMGFQFGIIDDPIKNREEAESPTYRNNLWEWYTSTFYTRAEKDAAILITATRWHEDDLIGRLLQLAEDDPGADQWTVIRFPAVAEPDDAIPEDMREEGKPLWPNKFSDETLGKIKSAVGSYQWASLYQQRPTAREGGMFKRHWFTLVDVVPVQASRVRYWDKAGTEGGGDFSCGALLAKTKEGIYYVEDIVRGQWSSHQRNEIMKQTAELDKQKYESVKIWVEQEPGSGGKESAEATVKNLSGFSVRTERVTGAKEVRADPFAAQCEAGNVRILKAAWTKSYLDELCTFPNGKNDDTVDASDGAFNKLARGGVYFA